MLVGGTPGTWPVGALSAVCPGLSTCWLSSCAAIKFTARIEKRKTYANLIFPWGSFISVPHCYGFCCVCRNKMNRRSRDDMNVFPHCNDPMHEFIDRSFAAHHKAPEVT